MKIFWMLLVMAGLSVSPVFVRVSQHAGSQRVFAKKRGSMAKKLTPLVTNELRLVDDKGRTRLVMTTRSDNPVMELLRPDGSVGISVSLDANGHGSVQLSNPNTNGPVASLEIDDKGAHVKFDRPGGASSYLFLNNAGESGVVRERYTNPMPYTVAGTGLFRLLSRAV
jgi:hypothetical protein